MAINYKILFSFVVFSVAVIAGTVIFIFHSNTESDVVEASDSFALHSTALSDLAQKNEFDWKGKFEAYAEGGTTEGGTGVGIMYNLYISDDDESSSRLEASGYQTNYNATFKTERDGNYIKFFLDDLDGFPAPEGQVGDEVFSLQVDSISGKILTKWSTWNLDDLIEYNNSSPYLFFKKQDQRKSGNYQSIGIITGKLISK